MFEIDTLCPACGRANKLMIDKVTNSDLLEKVHCSGCSKPLGELQDLLAHPPKAQPRGADNAMSAVVPTHLAVATMK